MRWWVCAGWIAFVLGCGGPDAKSPKATGFPSREALAKIAEGPLKKVPSRAVAPVPLLRIEPGGVPESSPAEARVAGVVAGLRFERPLRCAARELAKLFAEHGAEPDERVTRFIVGGCGITSVESFASFHLTQEVPPEMSDEEVLNTWQSKLNPPVVMKQGRAGAWFARSGRRAVLMLTAAGPETVTASLADPSGTVVVQGTTPPGTELTIALVNQGRDRVATCDPDPYVVLPRFSFLCRMAEGDPWAWIAVATRPAGRLLTRAGAVVLARRDNEAPIELAMNVANPTTEEDPATRILDRLNRARSSAGLGPVVPAPKQAATNSRLAGHFFGAEIGRQGDTAELIALGLIAGWDVDGTIRKGDFFSLMLSGTRGISSWMDFALEQPMGRFTLLRADAQKVAIGVAPVESSGGLGVVITTYSLFGPEDPQTNAARVWQQVAKARAARGLPPASALPVLPAVTQAASLVTSGESEPTELLGAALNAEATRTGIGLRGWVLETYDLDELPFLAEMMAPALALRVVVAPYRPANSPWGRYAIFVVAALPQATPQRVASRSSGPR